VPRVQADEWNERYASTELVWGVAPNRFVAEELRDLPPGRALDLACGEGRNAIWLAQRGWQVAAVDFAAVAIEKGRKLAASEGVDVDWRIEDVTQWTPEPGAFDLVLVAYLQLAARDRVRAFERAAAAVAPRGTFFVVAHDSRNLTDGHGGPQDARVLYTAGDVVGFLDGFDVERAGEVFRALTRADGTNIEAIDCLVRAVRVSA
jgi:SAM-dependent methyltransferase